jgi:HK97 gp10 family phage protein
MSDAVKITVDGLDELDASLGELTKATARNVLKRVAIGAGQLIADAATALVPVGTKAEGDDHPGLLKKSIAVSTKVNAGVGKSEYAAALAAGLPQSAAVAALKDARRAAQGDDAFASAYVGPTGVARFYSHLVEFGSVHNTPHPFMRPAWEATKVAALDFITKNLGDEIAKAAQRAAQRSARLLAKSNSGS